MKEIRRSWESKSPTESSAPDLSSLDDAIESIGEGRVSSPRKGVRMRVRTCAVESSGLESRYASFVSAHCQIHHAEFSISCHPKRDYYTYLRCHVFAWDHSRAEQLLPRFIRIRDGSTSTLGYSDNYYSPLTCFPECIHEIFALWSITCPKGLKYNSLDVRCEECTNGGCGDPGKNSEGNY